MGGGTLHTALRPQYVSGPLIHHPFVKCFNSAPSLYGPNMVVGRCIFPFYESLPVLQDKDTGTVMRFDANTDLCAIIVQPSRARRHDMTDRWSMYSDRLFVFWLPEQAMAPVKV